ncbi:MAG: 5'-deoxynucleotidase [Bacillota bacterium]|jgi:5'-deoxynucleotidase
MSHFFAYISKMKWIRRWGLMKNTAEENIMEHSWQVAVIAHGLATVKNEVFGGSVDAEHIAMLALYHETGEVITGDFATPIKYFNPEVKQAIGKMEHLAKKRIHEMLPEELRPAYQPLIFPDEASEEYQIVKAADRICAYLKCVEEMKWGNREFEKAAASIGRDIEKIDRDEVRYFMEHFVESFSLTLDELN